MPAGDGTGPFGLGPMAGRAAGYCAGYAMPGYVNPIPGRGFWGRGGYWGANTPYGSALHGQRVGPYGYGSVYIPVLSQTFGRAVSPWFGRGWGRGRVFGRGFGRGRGRGFGLGRGFSRGCGWWCW